MRLKTKLVLAATCVTFAIVLVLSLLFLGELLRQRIAQTAANNDVLARQLLMMTRQAVEVELRARPPADRSEDAFHAAVADALRSHQPLIDTMNAFVRYNPAVQDVSVTDAHGYTLVSTDPAMWNQLAASRMSFDRVRDAGALEQVREVFGRPQVLDVAMPLDRNGMSFLVVHIGLRSTFLENNYVPWLKDGLLLALLCAVITMVAAGFLANMALRPIEEISRRLERLAGQESEPLALPPGRDAVVRVTRTIERLGEQMQTTEAGYTDLQANLAQMLDTLRDGVLLFTGEERAAMVSDAVANFVETDGLSLVGRQLTEIFKPETALGRAVLEAFELERNVTAASVPTEDGRVVEISVDHVHHGAGDRWRMGTLVTLHDAGTAMRLEKELEVSRRLAAVGRLTAGVGHEVKNPINAMVVHLELLKGKLAASPGSNAELLEGAQRHVEILAGEMQRLDRVVQTLADFTRPMELHLSEIDVGEVARSVLELTGAEMAEHKVRWECDAEPVAIRADDELVRQALLNLMLNGMQAMPEGGLLRVRVRRDGDSAVVSVADEGSGIAPELMPRIFELYFTTKPKGSGIGLAMTYRIVQMHGGAMEVESKEGSGAVFTVRLPAIFSQATDGRRGRIQAPAGRIA
jgi:signal transduction histidine kinase